MKPNTTCLCAHERAAHANSQGHCHECVCELYEPAARERLRNSDERQRALAVYCTQDMKIPIVLPVEEPVVVLDDKALDEIAKETKKCDCPNPHCSLPLGRCYLCGGPTNKATEGDRVEHTVGPCCIKLVRDLRKQAHTFLPVLGIDHDDVPWDLFNDSDEHGPRDFGNIEGAICSPYKWDDYDAAKHVAECLGITPCYPDGC